MSLTRARVIKAKGTPASDDITRVTSAGELRARRIPALVVDAKEEAARIVAAADAKADAMLTEARASVASIVESAAHDAREKELARVTAELLVRRATEEEEAEKAIERTIELAALLAERLVGEAIAVEPARVTALARSALLEARGARQIRIEACADDVPALDALLASIAGGDGRDARDARDAASVARVEVSQELARGSLVVHTDLGRIDARLAPQLTRLAEALRVVLRSAPPSAATGGRDGHE